MQNDSKLNSKAEGIRPAFWLLILVLVLAGAVGIVLSRRNKTAPSDAVAVASDDTAPGSVDGTTAPAAPAAESAAKPAIPRNATGAVNANFQKYRKALLDGDGETAWSLVDSKTQHFYSQTLRDALSMQRAELDRLDYTHKFQVLRLRTEFRKSHLEGLTGRDVFVLAVTNGWISKSAVQAATALQRVAVNGRYAVGVIPQDPKAPLHFIYEDSEWKLSLWKIFEFANAIGKQMKKESGLSEDDFSLALMRQLSKFEVSEKIFEGPIE